MIDPDHATLSIQRQCELLSRPRSSYCQATESDEHLWLMQLIDEEDLRPPCFEQHKMQDYLRRQGYRDRKRVQRLMQTMGLASLAPKPNTSAARPASCPSDTHQVVRTR